MFTFLFFIWHVVALATTSLHCQCWSTCLKAAWCCEKIHKTCLGFSFCLVLFRGTAEVWEQITHYSRTGEIFHLPTAAQGFAVSDEMSFPAECYRAEVLTSNHCHYPVLEATLLALLKAQFVHFHFGILQDKPLTITHRLTILGKKPTLRLQTYGSLK